MEFFKANEAYRPYRDESGICTVFNAAEAYYILRSQYSEELARKALTLAYKNLVDVPLPITEKAMQFRSEFNSKNKQKLSYADAIGYTYALENGLEFVTGDDAFKGLKGVRFLK